MADRPSVTGCLSVEPHDNNITNPLLHFLGCIEICERKNFLNGRVSIWKDELEHQCQIRNFDKAKDPDEAKNLDEAKKAVEKMKEGWTSNFNREMKRIATLRRTLFKDDHDTHLVTEIDRSRRLWRNSPRYKEIIEKVRKWRNDNGKENGVEGPSSTDAPSEYVLEKDVSVPIIHFKDCDGAMVPDDKQHLKGKFPNQKTTIEELFANSEPTDSLLYKSYNNKNSKYRYINYFHIPSNNMMASTPLRHPGILSQL